MALTPSHDDKNRDKILNEIEKTKKENTAQAADKLKEEHNIGEKQKVRVATQKETAQVAGKK